MEHEATVKPPEFDDMWIKDEQWQDAEFLSGLPLGFVTSQWFTQLNFKPFDHKVIEDWKELGGVDHYIRYADDIVAFGRNKKKLHRLEEAMQDYLKNEMHQKIKYNWQVFRFEYPDRKAPPVIDKKTGKEKPKTRGRALDFMGHGICISLQPHNASQINPEACDKEGAQNRKERESQLV